MREGTKVGRTAGGVTSVEGQLVNYQVPERAIIHACIYVHPFITAA